MDQLLGPGPSEISFWANEPVVGPWELNPMGLNMDLAMIRKPVPYQSLLGCIITELSLYSVNRKKKKKALPCCNSSMWTRKEGRK